MNEHRRFEVGRICPAMCGEQSALGVAIEILSFSRGRHALRYRLHNGGRLSLGSAHITLCCPSPGYELVRIGEFYFFSFNQVEVSTYERYQALVYALRFS